MHIIVIEYANMHPNLANYAEVYKPPWPVLIHMKNFGLLLKKKTIPVTFLAKHTVFQVLFYNVSMWILLFYKPG